MWIYVFFKDGFSTSGMRDIKQKEAEDRLHRVNFSAENLKQAKLSRKKDNKTLLNWFILSAYDNLWFILSFLDIFGIFNLLEVRRVQSSRSRRSSNAGVCNTSNPVRSQQIRDLERGLAGHARQTKHGTRRVVLVRVLVLKILSSEL